MHSPRFWIPQGILAETYGVYRNLIYQLGPGSDHVSAARRFLFAHWPAQGQIQFLVPVFWIDPNPLGLKCLWEEGAFHPHLGVWSIANLHFLR